MKRQVFILTLMLSFYAGRVIAQTCSLTSGAGSDNQAVCINTAIGNITYTLAGSTSATVSGLPTGVSYSFTSPTVTISGTPGVAGVFNYTVTLDDGSTPCTSNGIITVNPLPAAAGSISGSASVCPGQTGVSYNVGAITGATSYTWSYSGAGATINGTTNSIAIDFAAGATSGNLTVYGLNSCGNGTTSAAYPITVGAAPDAAGSITGTATVCQGQAGVSYSISAISGATGYSWSYSGTGATIVGATSSVTINFAANATSGNLTVYGTNACGNGGTSPNYGITVNLLPVAAGSITGSASVCQGQSGVSYSVGSVSGATSYSWSYSGTGASIIGTSTNITINFAAGATSGNLTVSGVNACGNGTASPNYGITVNSRPVPTISGPAPACITSTGNIYATESGMSGYNWTVSSGGTPTSGGGPGNSSVTVTWNTSGAQTVKVNYTDGNGCSAASQTTYNVTVNTKPNASNVQINGVVREYETLTVSYDYVPGVCFPEDLAQTVITWKRYNNGSTSSPSATTVKNGLDKTFTLTHNDLGKYFEVEVELSDGATLMSMVKSARTGAVTANQKPVASGQSITGTLLVNNVLTGNYTYSDAESDPEGSSVYEWWRANSGTGTGAAKIDGAGSQTYTLTTSDRSKWIKFKVTPKASTGTTTGDLVETGWAGQVTDHAPVASNVIISGTPVKVDKVLTGNYQYSDAEGDLEGNSGYQWYSNTIPSSAGASSISGATSISYLLTNAEIGEYIGFSVTPVAQAGSSPGSTVTTATWVGPVTNDPPVAIISPITGSLDVNGLLTGNYAYSDAEGDPESGSTYQWYSSSPASGGIFSIIPGETGIAHIISNLEQGYYFKFYVTPRASSGTTAGSPVLSSQYGPANSKPIASNVQVTGTAAIGSTLTGSYTFSDPDPLDGPGPSTFRWLRNGTTAIPGATSITYPVTSADEGYNLSIEVTPVSATGYPNTGTAVQSSQTSAVIDPSPLTPTASEVCIEGIRAAGQVVRGKYLYTFYKSEGVSTYQWYRDGSPISGATGIQYTLKSADVGTTTDITFEVTPRSSNIPAKVGAGVRSNPLARIIIPKDEFSVAEKDVVLSANVPGGVFSGNGVTGSVFSPRAAGASVTPYTLTYILNIINTNYNCSEQATRQVLVNPNYSAFNGFNTVYCHDSGQDNITVTGVPVGATLLGYKLTNPKGLISQSGLDAVIDPGKMRPGVNKDSIYFSYIYNLTYYEISQPFVIDSVSTAIRFLSLKPAYCESEPKAYITVEGVYPPNGTASWTGGILSDLKSASAYLDPSLGTPGTTYPVIYRYRSPNGCYSKVLSTSVKLNPLPNPSFPLNATYNIEGGQVDLVPVQTGGKFYGNGVSGSRLFPDIAGTGDDAIKYIITDANNCTDSLTRTTTIRKAQGIFNGIPSIICYASLTYNISVTGLPAGVTITGFKNTKNSLVYTAGSTTASYNVPSAGKGDDTLSFTYKWDGVDYRIWNALYVDSLGQAAIKNLNPGEIICDNVAPYELFPSIIGGTFTGPVSGGYLDPTKASGPASVSYTYINNKTGCSTSTTVPITIYPASKVAFLPKDVCIESNKDTTVFLNNTTSTDRVSSWKWEFVEAGKSSTDTTKTGKYLFTNGGLNKVILTATTINSCSASKESTIDLGVKPVADFYWQQDCYHKNLPGDIVKLIDTTSFSSPVNARSWQTVSGTEFSTASKYASYVKTDTGYLRVQLIVKTSYANCSDTIVKDIYIRPSITVAADGYFEKFESGKAGWVKGETTGNTWSFGKPGRTVINSAASGQNAWYTNFSQSGSTRESSSIASPCFDFRNVLRPLIKISMWKRFRREQDGVVLQYKLGDAITWQNVGTINDDGIEWYNSAIIRGQPGNSQVGWTTIDTPDSTYIESIHAIDYLVGKPDVKFRIAYGSDGSYSNNDGVAFDNVWIGERSRTVLLEHFTNITNSKSANSQVNSFVSNKGKDVVNIQYHTNFPKGDPYYDDNPADASSRFLFYGITKAPFTFTDGGNGNDYAYVFDYSKPNLDTLSIIKRSLINPSFTINLNSVVSGGILTVSGQIKALEDMNSENLTLYIAVTERKNTEHPGTAGETEFYNVFRKFIPDAAGTSLKKTWTKNETLSIPEKTWVIQKVPNSSLINVVAFIQNNITKEIYQVASKLDIATGIDNTYNAPGKGFSIYPNPSSGKLTLLFEKALTAESDIRIYDFSGGLIKSYKAAYAETELTIEDLGLKSGIYLIRVSSGGLDYGFKKLIVSGR